MKDIFTQVSKGIYLLAVWSEEWSTYTNCYFLHREDELIVIDSLFKVDEKKVIEALSELGKKPEEVTTFIATHGHPDHIGNASIFTRASKWIHKKDISLLDEAQDFNPTSHEQGEINGIHYVYFGAHTQGSLVLYDRISNVLFSGDEICFFGSTLPPEGMIGENDRLRDEFYSFVESKDFKHVMEKQGAISDYIRKIDKVIDLEPIFLCSGHGGVLKGEISTFLKGILSLIEQFHQPNE